MNRIIRNLSCHFLVPELISNRLSYGHALKENVDIKSNPLPTEPEIDTTSRESNTIFEFIPIEVF